MVEKNKFASYDDAVDFLFRQLPMYQRQGPKALKYDLTNITRLMHALGNPHKGFRSIHIAGTNGKGSTAHLLSAAFQKNEYKTGLYTSPHYTDYRERIRIDGQKVKKDFIFNFMNENFEIIEKLKPSYFELSVAMAFSYFFIEKVDIAIVEVGLGGRLDSTNIITPLLSLITNISLDHTQTLGNTLVSIAEEKGGIIKEEIPVIIGEKQEEINKVFIDISSRKNAPIYFAEDLIEDENQSENLNLSGPFMKRNRKTAMAALNVFMKYYPEWVLSKENILEAFKDVEKISGYRGRWSIISSKPLIIADGGHNLGGWKIINEELEKINKNRLHMVVGFVFDKDFEKILDLLPKNALYYFCQANIPRALEAEILKDEAAKIGLKGKSYLSVSDALKAAKKEAENDDLIFIGGSIFIVGEIL